MQFSSLILLAILAVCALAAPQRFIEKTTVIRGGPGFGRPGFARPPPPPPFRGPGFGRGPVVIQKTTVIRG